MQHTQTSHSVVTNTQYLVSRASLQAHTNDSVTTVTTLTIADTVTLAASSRSVHVLVWCLPILCLSIHLSVPSILKNWLTSGQHKCDKHINRQMHLLTYRSLILLTHLLPSSILEEYCRLVLPVTTTTTTTTTTTMPFYSPLSGTTRVSRYQKKHSPIHTYPDHQSSLICFLHLL